MAAVGGLIITSFYIGGRPTIRRTSYKRPFYKMATIKEAFYIGPSYIEAIRRALGPVGPLGP